MTRVTRLHCPGQLNERFKQVLPAAFRAYLPMTIPALWTPKC